MLVEIKHEAIRIISHVQVQQEDRTEERARQMHFENQDVAAAIAEKVTGITEVVNEPCPCGSGKKYKQCCGKINSSSICHK